MNIVFVSLPNGTQTTGFPLGLGYLSASINSLPVSKFLFDYNKERVSLSIGLKKILSYSPDVVCLSIFSNSFVSAQKFCQKLRVYLPHVIVIIGGVHVTALPKFSLVKCLANVAIVGEGEDTFRELMEYYVLNKSQLSSIQGIVFRKGRRFVVNPSRKLIDVNKIPWVDWELISPESYPPLPHNFFYRKFPFASIISSRGCPYNCSFCSSVATWHQKLRLRSPQDVVNEIKYLHKYHGVQEFFFEDDNITLVKKHIVGICKFLLAEKLDILWSCPNGVRLDSLDEETVALMAKSGCYSLHIGIETAEIMILHSTNKRLDISNVSSVVRLLHKYNIKATGLFVVGLPGETWGSVRKTLSFAKKIKLDAATFSLYTPLPGSDDFKDYLKTHSLSKINWNSFNYHTPVADSFWLRFKLYCFHHYLLYGFYLRPKILFHIFSKIKMIQIKYLFRIFFDYFF